MARRPKITDAEELPEADRLDEFPHPRHTLKLFGHEQIEKNLAASFHTGRMHHGWLLSGTLGVGKATLAYRLAKYVLADAASRTNPDSSLDIAPNCVAAQQVSVLSHPGLLLIRRPYDVKTKRFAAYIPVAEVRRLRNFLSHKADDGAWRVVIVDSADEMNANSANALLKSLEEPPPRALFLLISSAPGRLLPTIRSRCRRLDLEPLQGDPLRLATLQALKAADLGHEDAGLGPLEPLAGGSVRQLLLLSSGGGLKLYERIHALLTELPNVDWPIVHVLADELASIAAGQRFETFFELLFGQIARAVRAGATGEGQRTDIILAKRLFTAKGAQDMEGSALASWAALWETMAREKADLLALNLDRKAFILAMVTQMQQLARR